MPGSSAHTDCQQAALHHQAGRLAEAETLYRQLLKQQSNAEALNGLGMVLADQGNFEAAVRAYQQAIILQPKFAEALINLGKVLLRTQNYPAAVTVFRRAATELPDSSDVHNFLGLALRNAGQLVEAIRSFQLAIKLRPESADQYNNLGDALQESRRFNDAIAAYRTAIALRPTFVEASYNLATALQDAGRMDEAVTAYRQTLQLAPTLPEAHNNLGNALSALGRSSEAITAYQDAIRNRPIYADAFHNLGAALTATRRFDEAIAAGRRAVELRPEFATAYHGLGCAYERAGNGLEALRMFRKALAIQPAFPDALNSLGCNYYQSGLLSEAKSAFDAAMKQQPSNAQARFNRGVLLLSQGDFERGLPEYEARWEASKRDMTRGFLQPLWDGGDLKGKRILLHAEQGLGDVIHFVRYVPLVQARGGRVLVRCWAPLKRLFVGQLGIEEVCTDKEPAPQFDTHYPITSLPWLLGTRLQTIPANVPYLVPDQASVDAWHEKLAGDPPGLKVGLVWAGDPNHTNDHYRSTRLATYAPLAGVPGVRFYGLQSGPGAEQAANAPAAMTIRTFSEGLGDMASTAALMQNLDLIIAVDTSACHLAGAIGKPVWLMLHLVPDWRWMLGRADTPWYPGMRLFRQIRLGDWSAPIADAERALRLLAA